MFDFITNLDDQTITFLFGGSALVVVFLVWRALLDKDPLPQRLKSLQDRRSAMHAAISARPSRRKNMVAQRIGMMKNVVEKLKLAKGNTANEIRMKLARAGWRSQESLIIYMFVRVFAPMLGGAGVALMVFVLQVWEMSKPQAFVLCFLVTIASYFLPELYLKNAQQKRLSILRKFLPDGFDLLVICAEAGLSLDAALDRVSREMAVACPELSEEVGLTGIELGFLPERHKALANLNERVPLPGIQALVNTLVQTERYGTPLAQALRVLAAEMREERMMKAEERAAKLPVILTVPMIIFILPPLFSVLIGPAALRVIDTMNKG
ncbi:MAG: type II secretion system F family protein [Alphaproteobacteria bacterium]|nr:MAG: type II secretion system F family protein [Alphaproteobacteria bacterium]